MPGPYSAGTVFLQVIPSFKNVQRDIGDEAKDLGRRFGTDMGDSFDKEFQDRAGRSSRDAGEKAGQNFSGAFRSNMRSSLGQALKDLGKDIDKTLGQASKGLNNLRDAKIGVKFSAEDALRDLKLFETRMEALSKDSPSVEVRFNATQALKQAQAFRQRVEAETAKPIEVEARLGGRFEDELQRRMKAAQAALPNLEIQADVEGVENEIAKIRVQLGELGDAKINIDIEDDEAIGKAAALKATVDSLLEKPLDISMRMDLEQAAAELETFLSAVDGRAVEIPVHPGFGGEFESELQSKFRAATAALPDIPIALDEYTFESQLAAVRARLATLADTRIGLDMNAEEAMAEAVALEAELTRLGAMHVSPEVDTNIAAALAKVEAFRAAVERPVDVPLEVNEGHFVTEMRTKIGAAIKALPEIELNADSSQADRDLMALRARLIALRDVTINADFDAGEAAGEMVALHKLLNSLDRDDVHIRVRTDAAAAAAQLAALDAVTKRSGRNGELATASFRAFNGILLTAVSIGPAIIPTLAAIAGGLLALGPAAVAAGAGVGGMLLGFSGIGNVLTALNNQQKNAAKDALANAKAMGTATRAVEDAQRSLSRARENAGRQAEDSARAVASAQKSETRASQEAAKSMTDAARRVEDARKSEARTQEQVSRNIQDAVKREANAQRDLGRAQENVLKTQKALEDARKAAADAQQDLSSRIRKGQLDERQGVVDLFNATVAYRSAQLDPGATNLDKENASIQYERAQLALEDTRTSNQRLAEEQKKAQKDGINGSDQVVSAQERVNDAIQAEKDARTAVQDAAAAADRARVEGAQQVADAQQAVVDALDNQADAAQSAADRVESARQAVQDALRSQSRGAADSQQAIGDAQRNLTEAQTAYQEALTKTGEIGSASMVALQDALSKLGPAGQHFAYFLFGLRNQFKGLRDDLQAGMLPGVEDALSRIMMKYGPGLSDFLTTLGKTLGDIFRQIGIELTNPMWQNFFQTFAQYAPGLLTTWTQIGGTVATAIANILVALAPFSQDFADTLLQLTTRFQDFTATLGTNKSFQAFLGYVRDVAPDVMDFLGALGSALTNVLTALAPYGDVVLRVVTQILDFIGKMDPKLLGAILTAVIGLVLAFQVFSGILATAGLLTTAFAGIMAGTLAPIIAAIIAGVLLVGVGIAVLAQLFPGFGKAISTVFEAAKGAFVDFWNALKPGLDILTGAFTDYYKMLWSIFGPAVTDLINNVKDAFVGYWQALEPALSRLADAWPGIAQGIVNFGKVVLTVLSPILLLVAFIIDAVIRVIGNLIGPVFAALGSVVAGIIDILSGVLEVIIGIFTGDFGLIRDGVVSIFSGMWEIIWGVLSNAGKILWGILKGIGQAFLDIFGWIYDELVGHSIIPDMMNAILWWVQHLWDVAVEKLKGFASDVWNLFSGIKNSSVEFIKGMVDKISEFFGDFIAGVKLMFTDFPTFFDNLMTNVGKAWDRIKDLAKTPIKWVVETVINQGLIDNFNKVVGWVGGDAKKDGLHHLDLPQGFAEGGRIGGQFLGAKQDNVLIRANPREFMQPVSAVDHYGVEVMEAMRRKLIPKSFFDNLKGFANGGSIPRPAGGPPMGIVPLGKWWQALGARVTESPMFGGVTPNVHKGTGHREGRAIDVNYGPGGENDIEKGFFDKWAKAVSEAGYHVLWRVAGHFNHLHAEISANGNKTSKIGGGDNSEEGNWITDPIGKLTGAVRDLVGQAADNPFAKMAGMAANKLVSAVGGGISGMLGRLTDFMGEKVGAVVDKFTGNGGSTSYQNNKKIVQDIAKGYGWNFGQQWLALDNLIMSESGYNNTAQNKHSTAFGEFQFLNGTWAGTGVKKTSDPTQQTIAGLRYISSRFGDPISAWNYHRIHGSYGDGGLVGTEGPQKVETRLFDTGGIVPPGLSQVLNMTGANEHLAVLKPEQIKWAEEGGRGGIQVNVPMMPTNSTPAEVADAVLFSARQIRRGGVYTGSTNG